MDDAAARPTAQDEMAQPAFRDLFPYGLPRAANSGADSAIVRAFPLEEGHLMELAGQASSPNVLGVTNAGLQKVSQTHHRLAQLLAGGMDEGRAAVLCNYGPATVSILKSDPMFQELLAYYASQVEGSFRDVVAEMADLHMDVVNELRVRLETNPAQFNVSALTDLMSKLSDRTGHGPSSSTNHNINSLALTGADLQRIKAEGGQLPRIIDGQVRVLSSEDQRALAGVAGPAPQPHPGQQAAQRERPPQGPPVRVEGGEEVNEGIAQPQSLLSSVD